MRTKRWGAVLLALLLFAQVFVGSQFSLDEVAYASALSEEQTPLKLQDTQPEDFEFDPLHKRITGFKEERAEAEEWNLIIPKQIDGVDVESIDGLAFYNNPHIHQVDFSQATALKQIGAYAFAFTPLDKIDLSQSNVEQIDSYAFFQTGAKEIQIGSYIYKVGQSAFGNNEDTALKERIDAYGKARAVMLTQYADQNLPKTQFDNPIKDVDLNDATTYDAFEKAFQEFAQKQEEERQQEQDSLQRTSSVARAAAKDRAANVYQLKPLATPIAGARNVLKIDSVQLISSTATQSVIRVNVWPLYAVKGQTYQWMTISAANGTIQSVSGSPIGVNTKSATEWMSAQVPPDETINSYDITIQHQQGTPKVTLNYAVKNARSTGREPDKSHRDSVSAAIELELAAQDPGTLQVSVDNQSSADVQGLQVQVTGGDLTQPETMNYTSGSVTLSDLAPGTYTVKLLNIPSGVKADQASKTVQVTAGTITPVRFTLTDGTGTGVEVPEPPAGCNLGPTPKDPKYYNIQVIAPEYTGSITLNFKNTDNNRTWTREGQITNGQGNVTGSVNVDYAPLQVTAPDLPGYTLKTAKTQDFHSGVAACIIEYEKNAIDEDACVIGGAPGYGTYKIDFDVPGYTGNLTATVNGYGLFGLQSRTEPIRIENGVGSLWGPQDSSSLLQGREMTVILPTIPGYRLLGAQTRTVFVGQASCKARYVPEGGTVTEPATVDVRLSGGEAVWSQVQVQVRGGSVNETKRFQGNGQTTFSVPAGTYTISLTTPSGYTIQPASAQTRYFTAGSTGEVAFNLVKVQATEVMTMVRFIQNDTQALVTAMDGKTVTIQNQATGRNYSAVVRAGQAAFQVPTGNYRLLDYTPPAGYEIASDTNLSVTKNNQVFEARLNLAAKLGNVSIRVLPPNRLSMPSGARVSLYQDGELKHGPVVLSSARVANFRNIPQGEYQVVFDGMPATWMPMQNPNPITVGDEDQLVSVQMGIIQPSSGKMFISGRIYDAKTKVGIEGVHLKVKSPNGSIVQNQGKDLELITGPGGRVQTADGRPIEVDRWPAGYAYTIFTTSVPDGYKDDLWTTGRVTASQTEYSFNFPLYSNRMTMVGTVTDSNGEGVGNVSFKIKKQDGTFVKGVDGSDLVLTTDRLGLIEEETLQLPKGTYTLVNTSVPDGYQTAEDQEMSVPDNATRVAFNVQLKRAGLLTWEIQVVDESGSPIPDKEISFYNQSTGLPLTSGNVPLKVKSDANGMIYIDQMRTGRYEARFAGDSEFGANMAVGTLDGKTNPVRTQLVLSLFGEKGRVTIVSADESGKPVGGMDYIIRNAGGAEVARGTTDYATGQDAKILPFGTYSVEFASSNRGMTVVGEKVKSVSLSQEKTADQAPFTVKRNELTIQNAGSLQIDGALVMNGNEEPQTAWTVTITKDASAPRTSKRGTQNEIRFPADQMIFPTKPILRVQHGDGAWEEVAVSGTWQKEGNEYVFRDDQGKAQALTDQKVVYEYTFQAQGLPQVPEYKVQAQTKFISDDPSEIFRPAVLTGEKSLNTSEAAQNVIFRAHGEGNGAQDMFDEVHWHYEGHVDTLKVPGKTTFRITMPLGAGLMPLEQSAPPQLTIYNEEGTEVRSDIPYKMYYDKDQQAWLIEFDNRVPEPFSFRWDFDTKVDRDQSVGSYTLDTVYLFDPYTMPNVHMEDGQLRLIAGTNSLPNGKQEEFTSMCDSGKGRHRVNILGSLSSDGKEIMWTVQGKNIDVNGDDHHMTLDIQVGEGLGEAKLESLDALGKDFPFVTKGIGTTTTDYVYDKDGHDRTAGKQFRINATPTNIFMGTTMFDVMKDWTNTYSYILGRKTDLTQTWVPLNYKVDAGGNEYFYGTFSINAARVSTPADQKLRVGDYVIATFRTPITDFNRATTEGYTITVNSKTYEPSLVNDIRIYANTNTKSPDCTMNSSLTLKSEKNQGEVQNVTLTRDRYAQVSATGAYDETGQGIDWSIKADVLKATSGFAIDRKNERNILIEYEFVDENKQSGNTGLANISHREEELTEIDGIDHRREDDDLRGLIHLSHMKMGEDYKLHLHTPILEDKPYYILKVTAYYLEEDGSLHPLQGAHYWSSPDVEEPGQTGDNVGYVVLEGRTIQIRADKAWQNVYDGKDVPPLTLILRQIDIAGNSKEISRVTLDTPTGERFISHTFTTYENEQGEVVPIPRFDEAGNRYQYVLTEASIPGYEDMVARGNISGEIWTLTNTRQDTIEHSTNPIEYRNYTDGRYSTTPIQSGPDIKNVNTTNLNSRGEDYKIEYEDSIVGKSGQQTDVPGMFDMTLTIEGYSKYGSGALDVVFVLDNSPSMQKYWRTSDGTNRSQVKMKWLRDSLIRSLNELDAMRANGLDVRYGIVNFATTVEPVAENKKSPSLRYPDKPWVGLTSLRTEVDQAVPFENSYRHSGLLDYYLNQGQTNFGATNDGQTNIAAGIKKGAQLLYEETDDYKQEGTDNKGRQKLLVVMTDGAPVTSLKLRHYPLDPNLSIDENLVRSGAKNPANKWEGQYIINNNHYYMRGNIPYYTEEGVRIDNNGLPTVAVSQYYQKRHPDMDIVSVAIAPNVSGFDPVTGGKNNEVAGDAALELMEYVCRSITTDSQKNYFQADRPEQLENYIDTLKTYIRGNSIVNGTVVDPMGDHWIILRDPDGRFTPASSKDLEDGDFYLSDNNGYYMDSDGTIKNKTPGEAEVKVTVMQVGRPGNLYEPAVERSATTIRLDDRGQPYRYYDASTNSWQLNRYENGRYRYLLAINHTPNGAIDTRTPFLPSRGFTVLTSLEQAIAARDAGQNLIMIRNTLKAAPYFIDADLGYEPDVKKRPVKVTLAGNGKKNLLEGVEVVREGDKILIKHLNLGTKDEVTLRYRIHIDTEAPDFVPDMYTLANKEETVLYPKPDQGDYVRYFPVPSVKAPQVPIKVEKKWETADGNPLPADQIPDVEIVAQVLQYSYKHDALGRPVDASGKPITAWREDVKVVIGEDGQPVEVPTHSFDASKLVRDPNSTKVIRSNVVLNRANNWTVQMDELPAYDAEGTLFGYEIRETNVPTGFKSTRQVVEPKISYNRVDGYSMIPEGAKYQLTLTNSAVDQPFGRFQLLKYDEAQKGRPFEQLVGLKNATFELVHEISPTEMQSEVLTTDDRGYLYVNNLEAGVYRLRELRAPSGYERSYTEYWIEVGVRQGLTDEKPSEENLVQDGKYVVRISRIEEMPDGRRTLVPLEPLTHVGAGIDTYNVYGYTNVRWNIPYTGYLGRMTLWGVASIAAAIGFAWYVDKKNKEKKGGAKRRHTS